MTDPKGAVQHELAAAIDDRVGAARRAADPKGSLLRIASQAREAEIVREAVEEHGPDVVRAVGLRRGWCRADGSIRAERAAEAERHSRHVLDALACLVALCNGEQWPPKEEK